MDVPDLSREIDLFEFLTTAGEGVLSLDEVALLLFVRERGEATPGEIAGALAMAPSKVTRCNEKLERLRLVEGAPDPADLRKCVFRLTNRGENAAFEYMRACGEDGARTLVGVLAGLRRAGRSASRRFGLPSLSVTAVMVLLFMGVENEALSVGALQERIRLSQSRISMALAKLRQLQLVDSEIDPSDRRRHIVGLTERGRDVAAVLTEGLQAV